MLALAPPVLGAAWANQTSDLGDLSLEELSKIVVSTVSGRDEPLSRAKSSVYVIDAEEIRRSGATTIPEALRLAPNLQVARTSANGYAISARGFNNVLANKLLVLIDGRSVYTPTFSGVFWDAQDVMLEDIERIEVISGPGGVLWGANAVNGVINILSKRASETRGGVAVAGAGNTQALVEGRYGGASGTYRAYVKASRLDDTSFPDGTENTDGTDRIQTGFRSDWTSGTSGFTVQGDVYAAEDEGEPEPQELRGANVLGRYTLDRGDGDRLRVQAYYDYTSRRQQTLDTADLAFEQVLRARNAHSVMWGGGLRYVRDRIENTAALAILPADKDLTSWNVYAQDDILLRDDLDLAIGIKVDRNAYTGVEYLPSARLGWRSSENDLLWAAVSRTVRTPSRFDRELFLPGAPPFLLAGGPEFESEISYAYELGYRAQPIHRFSWSATAFYTQLEHQRSISPGPTAAFVANDREGHSAGIEAWAAYSVTDHWRVTGGYTYLGIDLHVRSGAVDLQPESSIGADPRHWFKLRSALDLGRAWEIDAFLRHYDELDDIDVPAYTAVDARVAWSTSDSVELSLLLQNVFDDEHIEWSPGAEFERAAFLKARLRF